MAAVQAQPAADGPSSTLARSKLTISSYAGSTGFPSRNPRCLDEHPPIPAAIEHRHPAEPRHIGVKAPQERVALLVERGLGEGRHPVMPRVERLDEALDGAALSGGVAALEHEQDARAELARAHLATDVQTQLQPAPLGGGKSLLVFRAGDALREVQ